MKKYLKSLLILSLALSFFQVGIIAAKPLKVVVSFSVLSDMTHQVGKDLVHITSLVGPDGDAHMYEPTPADALALKQADLFIVNGVGFEGWMNRLIESSAYSGQVVVATEGVHLLEGGHHSDEHHDETHDAHEGEDEHEGENLDPHAWHDLANGQIYIKNITIALKALDPAHADEYQRNADRYLAQLIEKDRQIRMAWIQVPAEHQKIVTPHDALAYYGKAYGVTILAPSGWSTESSATAKDVARIIRQIREENVRAIFSENVADPRLVEQIARDGGGVIGGKLYSDALSSEDSPASTYVDMVWSNTQTMVLALTKSM